MQSYAYCQVQPTLSCHAYLLLFLGATAQTQSQAHPCALSPARVHGQECVDDECCKAEVHITHAKALEVKDTQELVLAGLQLLDGLVHHHGEQPPGVIFRELAWHQGSDTCPHNRQFVGVRICA